MVRYRPTAGQALARGAYLGAILGLSAAAVVLGLSAGGIARSLHAPLWLLALLPFATLAAAGALAGVAFGRDEGTDIDDWGIHCVPGAAGAAWAHIEDLQTERRAGQVRVSVRLDNGLVGQLPVPYDGRWLAGDRQFEQKLFLMRNLWETHRRFEVNTGFPPG
jgi:hypothetical protein